MGLSLQNHSPETDERIKASKQFAPQIFPNNLPVAAVYPAQHSYQSVRFLLKTGVSSRGGSLPKGGCAGIDQRHQLAVGDFHGLPTPSRKAAISCQALNSDSTQLRPPQVLARRNFLGFTPGSTQCSCHLQFRHRLHCLKSQILYACIPGC